MSTYIFTLQLYKIDSGVRSSKVFFKPVIDSDLVSSSLTHRTKIIQNVAYYFTEKKNTLLTKIRGSKMFVNLMIFKIVVEQ